MTRSRHAHLPPPVSRRIMNDTTSPYDNFRFGRPIYNHRWRQLTNSKEIYPSWIMDRIVPFATVMVDGHSNNFSVVSTFPPHRTVVTSLVCWHLKTPLAQYNTEHSIFWSISSHVDRDERINSVNGIIPWFANVCMCPFFMFEVLYR
jgi:hypothetical protein